MGRRKIDIIPILNERNRLATFQKRKAGLLKKAYELGVLCSVDIQVIIIEKDKKTGVDAKIHTYSSKSDLNDIPRRHLKFEGELEPSHVADFSSPSENAPSLLPEDVDEDQDMSSRTLPPLPTQESPSLPPFSSLLFTPELEEPHALHPPYEYSHILPEPHYYRPSSRSSSSSYGYSTSSRSPNLRQSNKILRPHEYSHPYHPFNPGYHPSDSRVSSRRRYSDHAIGHHDYDWPMDAYKSLCHIPRTLHRSLSERRPWLEPYCCDSMSVEMEYRDRYEL